MRDDDRKPKSRGPRTTDTFELKDELTRKRFGKALSDSGLTQKQLGERLGREQTFVGKVINGTQQSVTQHECEAWARAGKVSVNWLRYGDNVPEIASATKNLTGSNASHPSHVSTARPKTINQIRDLCTARFDLISSNINPEMGRNLILAVYFGSYSDGSPNLWDYEFSIDQCRVHVSTNALIVGRKEQEIRNDEGNWLRLSQTKMNLPNERSYRADSPISGKYLAGNYSDIEICLLKGDVQQADCAWLSLSPAGLIVTLNAKERILKGKARRRVLEQWIKLKTEEFDDAGYLNLCVTRFD